MRAVTHFETQKISGSDSTALVLGAGCAIGALGGYMLGEQVSSPEIPNLSYGFAVFGAMDGAAIGLFICEFIG